jgi:hypothetical protein
MWRRELPLQSGCYWWREDERSDPEVVVVFRGQYSGDVFFRGQSIGDNPGGFFWSEKLVVPK